MSCLLPSGFHIPLAQIKKGIHCSTPRQNERLERCWTMAAFAFLCCLGTLSLPPLPFLPLFLYLPLWALSPHFVSCRNTLIPVGLHLAYTAGHETVALKGKSQSLWATWMNTRATWPENKNHSRQSSLHASSLPVLPSPTNLLEKKGTAHSGQLWGSTSITHFPTTFRLIFSFRSNSRSATTPST